MVCFLRIIPALLLTCVCVIDAASVLDDYAICKAGGFGRTILLCDVDDLLALRTQQKLISLLSDLQRKVKCKCESGCRRPDGNDRYIGVLLVTNSTKIEESNETLNETAQKIYDDAQLGSAHCDNGLLIIYIKDRKQLATYHGSGSYILLNTRDMMKLHSMAIKNAPSDDTLALQYLLSNYENVRKAEVQRAETWTPIVGLFLALILVLLILALLLTLFLARFCCCCARRIKDEDEIYQIGSARGSKMMEPILVATPPLERIYSTQGDAVYSTPYSGTPLPPPHLPGLRPEIYPGSLRSSTATAASTQKHRIRPLHAPIPRRFSPVGTPITRSRLSSNKVDDSTQTNGNSSLVDASGAKRPELQFQGSNSVQSEPSGGNALSPRTAETSSTQRSTTGHTESDLSFLDPRRKQEVQTRTDFIY